MSTAILDDVGRAEVIALTTHGLSRAAVADYAGCDLELIENTARLDPTFGQQLRLARARFVCRNIEIIQRHAAQCPKNANWLLERLHPEQFAKRCAADVVDGIIAEPHSACVVAKAATAALAAFDFANQVFESRPQRGRHVVMGAARRVRGA